ncbi:MAG: nucleoside recognition domain-containing protein [Bacteroidota bacterium]
MTLNYIWIGFFLVGFLFGLIRLIFFGDLDVFPNMVKSTFDMSKTGFEISLYLTGVMTLWLGIMRIGEKGGMVNIMARLVGPFFSRLFPEIPKNHPALGSMIMNFSANMLGLDNAATPLGLKAMKEMQEVNKEKEVASNAQIMFLVLNTSGLTLIPLSIMIDRASVDSKNPTDVFIPLLVATFFSTIGGLIFVAIKQKIRLLDKVILAYLLGATGIIAGIVYYFSTLSKQQLEVTSNLASSIIILSIIVSFMTLGLTKKINLYETFIEGAKDGFSIAIKIIPYLIAILVAIGIFRESGAMDILLDGIRSFFTFLNVDTQFVDALPTAFMKPLSGSAARGMNLEIMKSFEPDSFVGRLSSVLRGATETTFYIVAVYFGSVNIKKTRYAITAGLFADLCGIIAAILIGYMFFQA